MTVLMAMGVAETPGIRRLRGLRLTDLICGPSSSESYGPTLKRTSAFPSADAGVTSGESSDWARELGALGAGSMALGQALASRAR